MPNQPYFTITITPTEGQPGRIVTDSGFPQPDDLDVRFDGDVKYALFAYASLLLTVPQLLKEACKEDPEKEAAWIAFINLLWSQISFQKVKAPKPPKKVITKQMHDERPLSGVALALSKPLRKAR